MGKITNVLKKIQELRRPRQDQEISDFFCIKDDLKAYYKKVVVMVIVAIIAAGTMEAVFICNEIYNLKESVKMQERRFNDLTIFLSSTKNLSDNEIQDFNYRLKNEAEDRKIQINKLALIDNVYYINLIKAINANTLQINFLDNYIKNFKGETGKISVSDSQNVN